MPAADRQPIDSRLASLVSVVYVCIYIYIYLFTHVRIDLYYVCCSQLQGKEGKGRGERRRDWHGRVCVARFDCCCCCCLHPSSIELE